MSIDVQRPTLTVDPRGLDALKRDAHVDQDSPETIRAVAKQFESLFAQMLIRSMRATSFGDDLMGSEQGDFYRDIFDQQLSVKMSEGKGLGLAEMLVRQLSGIQGMATTAGAATDPDTDTDAVSPPSTIAAEPVKTTATRTQPAPAAIAHGSDRAAFIRELWPHAEAAGRALGVDPATIVSHAALETGWGRSLPARADGGTSFNLFGIKAGRGWRGDAAQTSTLEYVKGVAQRTVAPFRAYESIGAAVADYARMLAGSPRYAGALNTGSDVAAFAGALQRAGYATDPAYASKLQSVAAKVHELLGAREPLKVADAQPINPTTRSAT
jgi:flagellar protein FlgJ